MKYKTFARVVLKLLGVYFTIMGGSMAAQSLMSLVVNTLGFSGSSGPTLRWYYIPVFIIQCLQLSTGLYLFFNGKWVLDKIIPSNRPYCPNCGYDLTGNPSRACPECGIDVPLDLRRIPDPAERANLQKLHPSPDARR